ncbi:glycosyltransferase family 2 protein [Vibrio lentus]|uniref:glycosyltransferase family 2 protein n=1 Tax=Vibrio lentus TaxID=136468 RepID=UPI00178C9FEC|nr:glycosyltransferase family 2 protein [Vibrio lentus]MDN3632438.1 glycosyltransferase family 2 protein [Vibrio lentus]
MEKNVDVVLASYNGSSFIQEQIRSMIESDGFHRYVNRLIVSDDNSTDNTVSLINSFNSEVVDLYSNEHDGGVIGNFESALSKSKSDYIILSDQDDVWCHNKINVLLNGIKKTEVNRETPALFFTDLKVVDENLNVINESFWNHQQINPELGLSLKGVLMQNVSPGCAMIINRALLLKALPFGGDILMHDWWLLLIANEFGNVGYSRDATFLYRQHGANVVGAGSMTFREKVTRFINGKSDTFNRVLIQSKKLYNLLPKDSSNRGIVRSLIEVNDMTIWARVGLALSLYDSRRCFQRNLAIIIRIIFFKKD